MKLILTRHGETIENKKGIIQGQTPGQLTEKGIEQARHLSERLKNEHIDIIYSSDLKRAADTAKEIAKHFSETDIHFVKELRERHFGEYQQTKKKDLGWSDKDFWTNMALLQTKEGETPQDFYKRGYDFVHKIVEKHPDKTVLFVCHGAILKIIQCALEERPIKDIPKMEDFKNTSVSIFDITEDKQHHIILHNCVKHL